MGCARLELENCVLERIRKTIMIYQGRQGGVHIMSRTVNTFSWGCSTVRQFSLDSGSNSSSGGVELSGEHRYCSHVTAFRGRQEENAHTYTNKIVVPG